MFSRKNKINKNNVVEVADFLNRKSIPSIIVSDLNIQGDLISEGAIEIGGIVNGNVKCNYVTIRKGAEINGDVQADNLVVNGNVNGTMTAKHLSVTSTGKVRGTLEYGFLNVEAGADIEGKLKKKQYQELEDLSTQEEGNKDEFIPKIENILNNNNTSFKVVEGGKVEEVTPSKEEEKSEIKDATPKKKRGRKKKTA